MALIFNGDWSSGKKSIKSTPAGQYELQQSAAAGGGTVNTYPPDTGDERVFVISEVPPGTSYEHSCRFKFVAGDTAVAGSQRAELQRPNPHLYPGEHVWAEEWIRVVEYDSTHWTLLRQFHEDEEPTGVAVGLYIGEGPNMVLEPGTGSAWWSKTFPGTGKWFRIKLHIYFHATEGIVEVWYGGEGESLTKQTLTNGKTVYENTNTLNAYSIAHGTTAKSVYDKVGFNRSNASVGTTIVDHAGTKLYSTDPAIEVGPRRLSMLV